MMIALVLSVALLALGQDGVRETENSADSLEVEPIYIVGWRVEPEVMNSERPTSEGVSFHYFDVEGEHIADVQLPPFPLRVESVSLDSDRSGLLYGVRVNGSIVYLWSLDVRMSENVENIRVHLMMREQFSRLGAVVGGRGAAIAEAEALWASDTARIPICPGDRRCE